MNARIVAFFAALLVVVAATYLAWKPVSPAELLHPGASQGAPPAAGAKSAQRGFVLAPARPASPAPRMAAAAAPGRRSLYNEYLGAKSYRALYDRLHGSPEGSTAEGMYVMYDILRKCAAVTDRPYRRQADARPVEQRRQEFLAALAPDDPQRDKRIAAFDATAVDHCAGLEGITIAQADLDKLLASSAAAGDPKAKATEVEQQVWQQRRAGQWRTATLSDTQIDTLEQAIGTKDPGAMVLAGRLLSNTWPDLTMHVGGDAAPAEPRALFNAWQVLACEYGYPCGADNARLEQECAYNGHCDAQNLPQYLFYYGSSPHEAELVSQYEASLRGAIENGDWSQIVVSRGSKMPGNRYFFGRGPG